MNYTIRIQGLHPGCGSSVCCSPLCRFRELHHTALGQGCAMDGGGPEVPWWYQTSHNYTIMMIIKIRMMMMMIPCTRVSLKGQHLRVLDSHFQRKVHQLVVWLSFLGNPLFQKGLITCKTASKTWSAAKPHWNHWRFLHNSTLWAHSSTHP